MLEEVLHFFGGAICHQLEDRSLLVDGTILSVCARCTGIYIGIFSTLAHLFLFKRKGRITIPSVKMSFFLLLLLMPLMVDGAGSYLNLFESNNLRRLITGISFGFSLPYFLYPLVSGSSLTHTSKPVIQKNKDLLIPLFLSISLGGLTYWGKLVYILLDGFIITIIVIWFSLCLSFIFTRLRTKTMKWTFSFTSSLVFLSILSFLHQMAVS